MGLNRVEVSFFPPPRLFCFAAIYRHPDNQFFMTYQKKKKKIRIVVAVKGHGALV